MSWHPIVITRDRPGFLRPFERTLSEHLAEELDKLEKSTGCQVITAIVVADTENEVEVVVKVEGATNE